MFVMVAFTILLCFWANQSPAAPRMVTSSETSMSGAESEGTGFIEQGETEPVVKKGKKFPWLIVGAVVVIGAAAVYFLVLKKTKYTLNVSLNGATGTPAATEKYKKGTVIAYDYTAQSGYINLEVKLDGEMVPASGSITMDKDHTLTATAVQGAAINVNSTPGGASIYLNNADSGFTTPHTFQYQSAVTETVTLRSQCGYQEWTRTISASLGQVTEVNATLEKGILENFDIPASSCWLPRTASAWTVSAGVLKVVDTNKTGYEFICRNHPISGDFTVMVKQKLASGKPDNILCILLSSGSDLQHLSGFEFDIDAKRRYSIYKNYNYHFASNTGSYSTIKYWGGTTALNMGVNVWNTIKIVKKGTNYSLFANDKPIFSFSSSGDTRYLTLATYGDVGMEVHYDSVSLTTGDSGESIPGLPENAPPTSGSKWSDDR
jgi:hypothetical protein